MDSPNVSSSSLKFTKPESFPPLPPPFTSYYTIKDSFYFSEYNKKIYVKICSQDPGIDPIIATIENQSQKLIKDFLQNPFSLEKRTASIVFHSRAPIPLDFLKESNVYKSCPNHPYCSTALLKDGRIANTYGKDIIIWNQDGGISQTLVGHEAPVYSLCVLPEARGRLVSGDQNGFIFIWDLQEPNKTLCKRAMGNAILSIIPIHINKAEAWDGTFATTAGGVCLWNINELTNNPEGPDRKILSRKDHTVDLFTFSLSVLNNGFIACGYSDNKILVFDSKALIEKINGKEKLWNMFLTDNPEDGKEDQIKAYECKDGDGPAHAGPIYSLLSCQPYYNEPKFISGSVGSIKIWNVENPDKISCEELFPEQNKDIVFSLAFHSHRLLCVSSKGYVSSEGLIPKENMETLVISGVIHKKEEPEKIKIPALSYSSLVSLSDEVFVIGSMDGNIRILSSTKKIEGCETIFPLTPKEIYNRNKELIKRNKNPFACTEMANKKMQLFLSGISHYLSKEPDKAKEFYQKAVHIEPGNPNIHLALLSSATTIFQAYRSLIAIYKDCGLLSHHQFYLEELVSLDLNEALCFASNDETTFAKIKKIALKKVKTIRRSNPAEATKICEIVQREFKDHKSAIFLYKLNPSKEPIEKIQYYYHVSEHAFQKGKYHRITKAFTTARKIDDTFTGLKEEEKLTFFTRKLTADLFDKIEEIHAGNPQKSLILKKSIPGKPTVEGIPLPTTDEKVASTSSSISSEDSNEDELSITNFDQDTEIEAFQSGSSSASTNEDLDETSTADPEPVEGIAIVSNPNAPPQDLREGLDDTSIEEAPEPVYSIGVASHVNVPPQDVKVDQKTIIIQQAPSSSSSTESSEDDILQPVQPTNPPAPQSNSWVGQFFKSFIS